MGLSLLLHGGVATAVYVFKASAATKAQMQLAQGQVLQMEVVSEPLPTVVSVPAPPVRPIIIPTPTPVMPPAKKDDLPVALPTVAPVAVAEPVAVSMAVAAPTPAPPASSASAKSGEEVPVNYLLNPKPIYPLAALRRQEEGLVILSVRVDPSGFPSRVEILQSSKFELLDTAAVQAVSQWRFTPARIGSLPVASQIEVPIQFRLADQNF